MSAGCQEIVREAEHLRQAIKDLERAARRGGLTLVVDGDTVITVYRNDRKVRR